MADCGMKEGWGMCSPWVVPCDQSYVPVCACDAMTYGNECMAKAAGVDIAHEGPC
jgi:hypothetical protein